MSRIYHPAARVTLGIVLESIKEDNRPFAFPARPQELTIFRNSYIEADTFSITFNASDLPITPDLIRAASAEVYLFNKRSLAEEPESVTKGDDSYLAIDGAEIKPSIAGLVDDAQMDYDEDGRTVTLIGRDYTGIFLDQDWGIKTAKEEAAGTRAAGTRMKYKGRLDKVIQLLADDVPSSAGIMKVKVVLGQEDGSGLSVGSALSGFRSYKDFVYSQRGESWLDANLPIVGHKEGRANRKGITFPNKTNYWEVMLALAIRYGFILFVKGTDIILTTPKAYIEGKTGSLVMAWGKNLHDIHMSRKLGRERVPTIECISWDESKQQVVRGQHPSKEDAKKSNRRKRGENANGLGLTTNEIQQYTIPGITSEKQLSAIAKQTHAQLGRAEMTVQISTSDLTDLKGETILDISSGDAMAVKFEPFNEDIGHERIAAEMVRRGYDEDVAQKLSAATEDRNHLREPMRVDDATIDYDSDSGITITASIQQFVNLVVQGEKA